MRENDLNRKLSCTIEKRVTATKLDSKLPASSILSSGQLKKQRMAIGRLMEERKDIDIKT